MNCYLWWQWHKEEIRLELKEPDQRMKRLSLHSPAYANFHFPKALESTFRISAHFDDEDCDDIEFSMQFELQFSKSIAFLHLDNAS